MYGLEQKRFNILDGVPEQVIETINLASEKVTHLKGEIIYQQGDPADHFYFLNSGRAMLQVETESGMTVILGALRPGYCFGWSAFHDEQVHRQSVVCTEQTEVSMVPTSVVQQLIRASDGSGQKLLMNVNLLLKDRLDLRTQQLVSVIESHPEMESL